MSSLNDGLFRKEFSHTNDLIYLNHCAIGPIPQRSEEAARSHLQKRSSGSVDSFEFDEQVITSSRKNAAKMINSGSDDLIALIPNTSHGLNLIASEFPWEDGDEILLSDIEFPANIYPYLWVSDSDTQVKKIDSEDGKIPVERIEAAITPKTKMIAISAVQFLSGYRADLETIGELCKKHKIYLVVDAIQAAGCCPLDVQQMQIDALVTGGHKWLLGAQGLGFMYMSEEFHKHLTPRYVGWLSVENPWELLNTDQNLLPNARRYEGGMYNGPGVHILNQSLELLLETGIDRIYQHTLQLQDHMLSKLRNAPLQPYGSGEALNRSGILAFRLSDSNDNQTILQTFADAGITVSIRSDILRIAPHLYNTSDEIEKTAEILENIPAYTSQAYISTKSAKLEK